jgi:D-glycero-D-manno-heptose 1,7-bisphosphate phosphatase
MLLDAARELGIDLRNSIMIGDSDVDIGAGAAVGAFTIRLGSDEAAPGQARPDAVAASWEEIYDIVLGQRCGHA